MPTWIDQLPTAFQNVIEDVDKFNKLPFYLVKNEVPLFARYNIWDQLFGDIPWQPNMGDTMKGVRPVNSPVTRALFYPNRINTDPNKDVFETTEFSDSIQLYWHDYQSKLFSFLPSWQDFRTGQLDFNHKDMVEQIQNGNNLFIRSKIWDWSPNVMCVGKGVNSELVTGCPDGVGNQAQTAAGSKNLSWLTNTLKDVKQHLTIKAVKMATTIMSEDLDVPFFEGAKNMPKPNEGLKGRYLLIGSTEAWLQFEDDPDYLAKRDVNSDSIMNFSFSGSLYNRLSYRVDKYPIRLKADGTMVAPQIMEVTSNGTQVRPNPDYISLTTAPYEVAFLVGAGACRTVKIGPPPKDFTGTTMDKFYKMRWNGEIRLTDQFLIQRGTVAGGDLSLDTNEDGRFLKLKATTTHGILPGQRYNALPIIYKRYRTQTT